jgi:hypothetical protein
MTKQRPIVLNMTRRPIVQKKKKKSNVTAVGRAIRMLGSAGGGALGGYFGQPVLGGAAGHQLGALASKWLGFGDYKVSQNSVLRTSVGVPAMHNTSQSILVRHKEYIGPVTSSPGFNVLYQLPLNPGLPGSFPWLSGVAARYQEYAIKGMVFHYVPASGNAISSTNPALGTVMIQTSYRASDSAPVSKVEMLNEYCASEAVPSEAFIHPIECDPKENPFNIHYVRATTPPVGEPLMSYDLGKTFIATQGQQAGGYTLGDIWVTYEIELKKPVITTDISTPSYGYLSGTVQSFTDVFHATTSTSGPLAITASGNSITIPPQTGDVIIVIYFAGSNMSTMTWTGAASLTNGQRVKCNNANDTYPYANITSGQAKGMLMFGVHQTDLNLATIATITGFSYAGTPGSAELAVYSIDGTLPL